MTIQTALIGAGRIGKVHAKSITADPRVRLAAVNDIVESAAADLAAQYGAQARSIDDILADKSIDAVLIASSTDTHVDLIARAVDADKAILCEKPVDKNLQRAHECARITATAKKPVMIGFNRRFDPNFAALKRAADAGEIGKLEALTMTSFDPDAPPIEYVKVSGGQFRDQMIHDFDICCWLLGVPEKVTAVGSCLVNPEIAAYGDVDTSVVTLQYADGRLATIRNTRRAAYGHDQRIELLGAEGMLSAGNVLENTVSRATAAGVVSAKPVYFFLERYLRAYEEEWRQFIDAVESGSPPPVSVQDGVNAIALAEAANISLVEERTIRVTPEMLSGT